MENDIMIRKKKSKHFDSAKLLSPQRKSTNCTTLEDLSGQQLEHFGIDSKSHFGKTLYNAAKNIYQVQTDIAEMWEISKEVIDQLDKKDKIAYFNAKRFLCFQIAKVLDTLQNPFRKAYQSLDHSDDTMHAKGHYPIFDNVTALFSANPVIVRTATYIYACTEWVDDAFHGKEPLHEIYSRLLNPTSISLANYIVDVEAGKLAGEYMAWNFNSGMAAIDTLFSHMLKYNDIIIVSRNVYGGTYQLLHDFYAKESKLNVKLEWFDGYSADEFYAFFNKIKRNYKHELSNGSHLHVFIESPCNPHGYVLDIPNICKIAHENDSLVALDSTVATPFLVKPLQRENKIERPDYLVHSYTKDLIGNGNATAGVIIGENFRMFTPKGEKCNGISWEDTIFWNVYYIKGAFLESDKAFEVISGMKTLNLRMLQKCINTTVLAKVLNTHPLVGVNCNIVESNPNYNLRESILKSGFPAPLFTIDLEPLNLSKERFKRFFDCLSPSFNLQVSLGQSNTTILCPAMTSHSEMDTKALEEAGISPTTMRISVGDENPKELIAHFINAAKLMIEPEKPGFIDQFPSKEKIDILVKEIYLDMHKKYVAQQPEVSDYLD